MSNAREYEIVFERGRGFERRALPPPPSLKSQEALIRPAYVGICGSDLFLLESQMGELRLGHEWVGIVEKASPSKGAIKAGDWVTSTGTLACFGCEYCKLKQTHFCDHAEYLSSDRVGALRSWLVVHQKNLVKIPGPPKRAHVIHEVVAVAEEGFRLIRDQFTSLPSELLVLGGGPIGAMLALIAERSGMHAIVVEKRQHRCEAVKALGIECIPLAQAIIDRKFSKRFSLVVDATNDGAGDTGGFRHLSIFAKKGFVGLMVGKYLKPQEIPQVFNRLGGRLVWMRGMPQSTLRTSVAKWNPRIEELAANYISEVIPVAKVKHAFELAATKSSPMKVVIEL